MGVVADAALAAGGEVFGVIPEFLVSKELAHQGDLPVDTRFAATSFITINTRRIRGRSAAIVVTLVRS